jgi:hypothetical protein
MENVILQRKFDPGLSHDDFAAMAAYAAGCIGLYRAEWRESFLSEDGLRLVCWFQAPDSESIRQLSRGDGSNERIAWSGTVHDSDVEDGVEVVVERSFDAPASMEELQAREDAAAWCLNQHRVKFIRSLFSSDRLRMICLYNAPDAESVRVAQIQAGMPVERVWACRHYTPKNLSLP